MTVTNRTWEVGDYVEVTTQLGLKRRGWIESIVQTRPKSAVYYLEDDTGERHAGTDPVRPSLSTWGERQYELNERMRNKLRAANKKQ